MHLASPVVLASTRERALEKLNALPAALRTRFRTMTLVGTPEEIVQAYRPLLAAGMQYCNAVVVGDDVETLELLAAEVVPALRPLAIPSSEQLPGQNRRCSVAAFRRHSQGVPR